MYPLQLRTLIFVAWVLGYVAFLLSIRRMWTGKYVRSPLVRSLFLNMVTEGEGAEPQKVGGELKLFIEIFVHDLNHERSVLLFFLHFFLNYRLIVVNK